MSSSVHDTSEIYGLLAEFEHDDELVAAALRAHAAGYRYVDAYTPMPIHGLAEALGHRHTRLPMLTLLGGIIGACSAYGLEYYTSVISYPLNVGGRPLHSWPAFLPITFELTVLGAAFFSLLGMLALNGLPRPYHPVFNVPQFKLASRNRFFLCIEARDPAFELASTRRFLEQLSAHGIFEVPP